MTREYCHSQVFDAFCSTSKTSRYPLHAIFDLRGLKLVRNILLCVAFLLQLGLSVRFAVDTGIGLSGLLRVVMRTALVRRATASGGRAHSGSLLRSFSLKFVDFGLGLGDVL